MILVEIANRIPKGRKKYKKIKPSFDWRPIEKENYTVPHFRIPETRNKANIRKQLSKVLAFIDLNKNRRYVGKCTVMPIPTTNKRLLSICGSPRNISRLIYFMENIGLIEVEDSTYQFYAYYDSDNHSRTYKYYYENEIRIIEYCKRESIPMVCISNTNTIFDTFVPIDTFEKSTVRFSSQLCLLKPINMTKQQFENNLTAALYENYPELISYQKLADEINETYYGCYPELAIRFVPTFKWSNGDKAIKKIGIRATNSYVAVKKDPDDDTDNEDNNGFYRSDILQKYGLDLFKDVASSVPRITLSLNQGVWIQENRDIYYEIYKQYYRGKYDSHTNTIFDTFISEQEFQFDRSKTSVREAIKSLHMRGYFDTEKMLGTHTYNAMEEKIDKRIVETEMADYRRAIIAAEGGYTYDSEIFYHESCIYMDVLKQLLDEGYFVWQCYDAWYAHKNGVSQDEFEKHVEKIVADKAQDYIDRQWQQA